MASDGGKGSAQRPTQVPQDVVDANFELIFGKRKKNSEHHGTGWLSAQKHIGDCDPTINLSD